MSHENSGARTKNDPKNPFANAWKELFEFYTQNAFGAVPKRELDIFPFRKFRELKNIDCKDPLSLSVKLGLTPTKIQNLIYEADKREMLEDLKTQDDALDETDEIQKKCKASIVDALNKKPCLDKNGETISLIIDNRFAREAIRDFLTQEGMFSDLSMASNVLKMSADAYVNLLKKFNSAEFENYDSKLIKNALKSSLKDFSAGVLGKILGDKAASATGTFIGALIQQLKKEK